MDAYGNIGTEKISVVVCDHPANQSYQLTGMPVDMDCLQQSLGWIDFTNKRKTRFTLQPGQSTTFRYRVIISSGMHLTDEEINKLAEKFAVSIR